LVLSRISCQNLLVGISSSFTVNYLHRRWCGYFTWKVWDVERRGYRHIWDMAWEIPQVQIHVAYIYSERSGSLAKKIQTEIFLNVPSKIFLNVLPEGFYCPWGVEKNMSMHTYTCIGNPIVIKTDKNSKNVKESHKITHRNWFIKMYILQSSYKCV